MGRLPPEGANVGYVQYHRQCDQYAGRPAVRMSHKARKKEAGGGIGRSYSSSDRPQHRRRRQHGAPVPFPR
jgi:hypothetical protein